IVTVPVLLTSEDWKMRSGPDTFAGSAALASSAARLDCASSAMMAELRMATTARCSDIGSLRENGCTQNAACGAAWQGEVPRVGQLKERLVAFRYLYSSRP